MLTFLGHDHPHVQVWEDGLNQVSTPACSVKH